MNLDKRSENLLRMIVEEQEVLLPGFSKSLKRLEDAGFVFARESENACFGDKSVKVTSSLAGEDYLGEIDGDINK